jgi:hypothetical protein
VIASAAMKKLCFLSVLFASIAVADSWTGTIVDVMCKDKDLASHTKQCAVKCAASGFGVVLPDGKFVKLDEAGNAKALKILKATDKEKDLKVKVTGKLDGSVIHVDSVELQ